jgi:hypothetical protein
VKYIYSLGFITLFLSVLSGCGTLESLSSRETYVQYATVNVTNSLTVSGQLVNINDSLIAISVDGAIVVYNKENILFYEKYQAPNPDLMQRDIVKNTQKSASNTGFFVGLTIISFVVAIILVL